MDRILDRHLFIKALSQKRQRALLHAIRNAKFLKAQGIHAEIMLEPYRVRSNVFRFHSQERSGFHVVETAIFNKKFDGSSYTRAFLNLVKEDQGVTWDERLP